MEIIINGGEPLNGCPKDWDEAKGIEAIFNKDKDYPIKWSFDCGFKLDYDGPVLEISSRFYPPKTHYGTDWDGNVTVYLMGKEWASKSFEEETLPKLKNAVEKYVKKMVRIIKSKITLNP